MAEMTAPGRTQAPPLLRASDGASLKASLKRAQGRQRLRAFLLVAPLLAFVVLTFVAPIAEMLFRSVENRIVADNMPQTAAALADWDPAAGDLPPDAAFAALVADMTAMERAKTHTRVGQRLNYEASGFSSLFRKTGRATEDITADHRAALIDVDDAWGEVATWATIRQFSGAYTGGYFLAALDMGRNVEGEIVQKSGNDAIYLFLFERTLWMSLIITALTLLLGYPIAWLLANLPLRTSNLLMILVLLPFWTSLLVRTSAWIVLLQQNGVVNDLLVWSGVIADDARLEIIFNQTGAIIAMTHILLPFTILPLYSVMKTIPPTYLRAAKSLGASNWTAFWRVYFPQTLPGVGAGAILVFILAIGYYVTPELVGGSSGVFISNRIAFHISNSLNWGLAAALATVLLVVVILLYWLYDRIVGIDNVGLR